MDEKKRKKNQILSWTIRGLLALLALYVGMQLLAVMNRGYKTETAIQYSMTDSITMDETTRNTVKNIDASTANSICPRIHFFLDVRIW